MGFINPILNLGPMVTVRPLQAALEPPPMERAEKSARTDDETYSHGDGQGSAASGGGSEESDLELSADDAGDEVTTLEPAPADETLPETGINLFA